MGVLLLLFLFAIAAGYVGGLLGSEGASQDNSSARQPIILEDHTRTQTPVGDTLMSSLYSVVRPSILGIYRVTPRDLAKPWAERALAKNALLGYALALTSDGWLTTTIPEDSDDMQSLLIIDAEHNAYRPQKIISDAAIGARYIKIAAENLKAAQIATDTSPLAQDGFLLTEIGVTPHALSIPEYPSPIQPRDSIQSTESLKKRFNPSTVYVLSGLPIVSHQKEVLGITTVQGAIPMAYIARSLKDVLKTGRVGRPKAGLQYFDNDHLALIPVPPNHPRVTSGATIVLQHPSLTIPTPTGTDRLLSGDVITAVNADTVDRQRSLSELLNEYQKNDPVQLKINRSGTPITVTMLLQ